jgi:hypothetical protein
MSARHFWHEDPDAHAGDELPASDAVGDGYDLVEMPCAKVTIGNEMGDLETVFIPYEPGNQFSEAEAEAAALETYAELEHLRSIVQDDAVQQVADDLKAFAGPIITKQLIEAARDTIRINITLTDDGAQPTPEDLTEADHEALEQEVTRLFHERFDAFVAEAATIKISDRGENFWEDYARDVIAHGLLWASEDERDEMGDAYASVDDLAFEARVLARYQAGDYLERATFILSAGRKELLIILLTQFLQWFNDNKSEKSPLNPLIEEARGSLRKTIDAIQTSAPAFNGDGYGRSTNDQVSIGARRALSAVFTRWGLDETKRPVFTHQHKNGIALYTPSPDLFPTPEAAFKEVEKYGDAHVKMLKFITTKHIANRAAKTTGPYGGFYVSIEEFLDACGLAKHVNGGHKSDHKAEVIELIRDLASIHVRGNVEGNLRGQRGKRGSISIEAPLIIISHTVRRKNLSGEETPIAWYLRPGDWATELEQLPEFHAITVRALMQLNTQNDQHALRLGYFLEEDYRIRAHQRSWTQPYRMSTLLAGAEIAVDRKNPGRFRQRIEAALDVLENHHTMKGTPVIASWRYAGPVPPTGRGGFNQWLAAGVVIKPPDSIVNEQYHAIGDRPKTRSRRP